MPPKPWRVISSKQDKSYRVFSLRTDRAVSPRTGLEHDFFILESSSWVNVIPLTPQDQVVLVRQYRHGIRGVTLEIPGGLVESYDTPEGAARRELYEETGYRAPEMIPLGSVQPNPAIQNNRCYTFLARNTFLAGNQQQDEREDIEVLLHPITQIPRLIEEGEITHALVLAAFYRFFMEHGRSRPSRF
jgi:ADP-ribose pyrophosphatase